LHAHTIEYYHSRTGDLKFEAPWPSDFTQMLAKLEAATDWKILQDMKADYACCGLPQDALMLQKYFFKIFLLFLLHALL